MNFLENISKSYYTLKLSNLLRPWWAGDWGRLRSDGEKHSACGDGEAAWLSSCLPRVSLRPDIVLRVMIMLATVHLINNQLSNFS